MKVELFYKEYNTRYYFIKGYNYVTFININYIRSILNKN